MEQQSSTPTHHVMNQSSQSSTTTFFHEFLAGQVGGVAGILTVYPLDTAKIRLQTSLKYTSTYDVLSTMIRDDGIRSLYRGLASPVLGFGLTFAVSFSAYGYGCRSLSTWRGLDHVSQLTLLDQSLAGGFTAVVQTPIRQVIERVKSVMQVREGLPGKSLYSWSGACLVDLVRREGIINGLFQGTGSVLLREIPQFAAYYPTYEYSKRIYTSTEWFNPTMCQFFAGGTAGVVQWLPPFFCFDVIKSRMQTSPPHYYKGILDCAFKLYCDHGITVFFRGLSPALIRAFPLHAIIFVGYESTLSFLQQQQQQQQG